MAPDNAGPRNRWSFWKIREFPQGSLWHRWLQMFVSYQTSVSSLPLERRWPPAQSPQFLSSSSSMSITHMSHDYVSSLRKSRLAQLPSQPSLPSPCWRQKSCVFSPGILVWTMLLKPYIFKTQWKHSFRSPATTLLSCLETFAGFTRYHLCHTVPCQHAWLQKQAIC